MPRRSLSTAGRISGGEPPQVLTTDQLEHRDRLRALLRADVRPRELDPDGAREGEARRRYRDALERWLATAGKPIGLR